MITTGNHVYRHREVYDYLDRRTAWSARPTTRTRTPAAATPWSRPAAAGRGDQPQRRGRPQGRALPFHAVDAILERIEADAVVVDFHAEVTSEKVAMGWHLDGRVAAVFGTHTHVPTADAPGAAAGAPPSSPTSA